MSSSRPAGPGHAEFEHDDAAFVLGALSPRDRATFEAHLRGCPLCTARVADLTATAGALVSVRAEDVLADVPAPPDTLLPGLLRRARAQRRRRRGLLAAAGGVAAAAITALAVALTVSSGPSTPVAAARQMTAVTASPVRASAVLADHAWGTEITVDCSYATTAYPARTAGYRLQVIDRDGATHDLGSWTLHAGGDTEFTSGTDLARAQIRTVRITLADGTPILQLTT